MRNVFLVAGQELWTNFRRPAFLILTFVLPLLGLLGLLLIALFGGRIGRALLPQGKPSGSAMGYVDPHSLLTADLPHWAGQFVAYPDADAARGDLLAGKIASYFVLPAEYLQSGTVVVYGIEKGFSTFVSIDEGRLRAFLVDHLLAGKVDPALQARVRAPAQVNLVRLDESGQPSTNTEFSLLGDFVIPYLFAVLFVVALFTASGYLLQGVAEEKEGRIIELLLSSISPTELLAGKIVGLGALGLIQLTFWVGSGGGLLGTATALLRLAGAVRLSAGTVAIGAVYFLLGYILFATLMAAAGSLGSTARESQQIAGIFSLAAAVPWMLVGVVLNNPNSPIAVALSYVPFTAPVMMLLRIGFGKVPISQILISVALLVAGIAFCLWAGARVFRAGLLMVGKRPGLRELARALRQAG